MELSERCIQTLEKEGYPFVYETQDAPEAIYEEHTHAGQVTLFITEGAFNISLAGVLKPLTVGDRVTIPKGTPYSAVVGPHGCQLVVGEMIDGDF
jgi:mannose-6-phosphate isomerase-like protein (cupin superfamily)